LLSALLSFSCTYNDNPKARQYDRTVSILIALWPLSIRQIEAGVESNTAAIEFWVSPLERLADINRFTRSLEEFTFGIATPFNW
jgi:hypothetical protein